MKGVTLSAKARKLMREFEAAIKDNEWIGVQDPRDWDAIITAYGKAKGALASYIYSLEEKGVK